MILIAYFDDTGTDANSPAVGYGGLFGPPEMWSRFNRLWTERLQHPFFDKPSLRRFHMTECMARQGDFLGYSLTEQDAIVHDFRQIILQSGLWGIAVAASKIDWDNLVSPQLRQRWGSAEEFCFTNIIYEMIKFVHDRSPDPRLRIVFDERREYVELVRFVEKRFKNFPFKTNGKVRTHLTRFKHLPSRICLPLQGADMFAWEIFRHVSASIPEGRLTKPTKHAQRFYDTEHFKAIWWDRNAISRLGQSDVNGKFSFDG